LKYTSVPALTIMVASVATIRSFCHVCILQSPLCVPIHIG